jgi:hypothetical protein
VVLWAWIPRRRKHLPGERWPQYVYFLAFFVFSINCDISIGKVETDWKFLCLQFWPNKFIFPFLCKLHHFLILSLLFELRASCLEGRCFVTCAKPPIYSLWLFWRWEGLANYLLGLASNRDPPYLSSQIARITGVNHECPAVMPMSVGLHIQALWLEFWSR